MFGITWRSVPIQHEYKNLNYRSWLFHLIPNVRQSCARSVVPLVARGGVVLLGQICVLSLVLPAVPSGHHSHWWVYELAMDLWYIPLTVHMKAQSFLGPNAKILARGYACTEGRIALPYNPLYLEHYKLNDQTIIEFLDFYENETFRAIVPPVSARRGVKPVLMIFTVGRRRWKAVRSRAHYSQWIMAVSSRRCCRDRWV